MILILGVLSGSLAGAQEFKEYPSSARAAEQDALASLNAGRSEENPSVSVNDYVEGKTVTVKL